MQEDDRDVLRLTLIVELIERVRQDVQGIGREQFLADRRIIDATAFRLGSIGEYASKLSPERKARHATVDWRRAYDMRNALFHDYDGIIPALLWTVLGAPLDEMATACRAELARAGG